MLQVVAIGEAPGPRIVVDDYVPLTVEWEALTPVHPIYWRAGHPVSSLVEVGLDPRTGSIFSIVLTLAGDDFREVDGPEPDRGRVQTGHPRCDVSAWTPSGYLDEQIPFQLVMHGDALTLWFGGSDQVDLTVASGSLRFHLAPDGSVLGLGVRDLSEADRSRLKDAILWEQANRSGRAAP